MVAMVLIDGGRAGGRDQQSVTLPAISSFGGGREAMSIGGSWALQSTHDTSGFSPAHLERDTDPRPPLIVVQ